MIHITATGYYAGTILCGKRRTDLTEGETTAHWPYSLPKDKEQDFRAKCCPDCLKVWDEAEDDE